MVFAESLHSLVAGKAEMVVESCRATVAVLGALPEQPVVVAEIGGTFHLRCGKGALVYRDVCMSESEQGELFVELMDRKAHDVVEGAVD